jgi:hypothetical protein
MSDQEATLMGPLWAGCDANRPRPTGFWWLRDGVAVTCDAVGGRPDQTTERPIEASGSDLAEWLNDRKASVFMRPRGAAKLGVKASVSLKRWVDAAD